MDMLRTVREIGFWETGHNLEKVLRSDAVRRKAGETFPLPDKGVADSIERLAVYLAGLGKRKYMFLTPEIAVIEKLAALDKRGSEALILVPCDMEIEVKERLRDNLPKEMKVSLLEEPYFPKDFLPGNGVLIACGYITGNKAMVLSETFRMIEHYREFRGKKVFVPYVEMEGGVRYTGWKEISTEKFSMIWRKAG